MSSIADIIENGEIATPLCMLYNEKQSIFKGGVLAKPKSPVLIKMVTDALNWAYTGGAQTTQEQTQIANYLVWLMGKFGMEASNITGSGGSVVPIVPGGLTPSRIDFIVSGSSYIATGESTKTITQFIGREIDFIRNGISQSTINTEPTYISWNKTTGVLTISPALAETELISIIPS